MFFNYTSSHLRAFSAKTKNLSVKSLVPSSKKTRFNLTSVFLRFGDFSLSKSYLILGKRVAMNGHGKSNDFSRQSFHSSFPKIGEIYGNLGVTEMYLGNTAQARKYYKEAIEILSRQRGSSHTSVSDCYINMAGLDCSNEEECGENEMYAKRALEIDNSSENKALMYTNLGKIYFKKDNLEIAEEYFVKARQILVNEISLSKSIEQNVVNLALVISNLGALYYRLEKYDDSKVELNISIRRYLRITELNNIHLGNPYFNMGLVYVKLNELLKAERCFRQALEIYSMQQLELSDERIGRASSELVDVLEKTGQVEEAAKVRKQYTSVQ